MINNGFIIDNGILVKYKGNSETVIIPNGVTQISGGAFTEISSEGKLIPSKVKSITIPKTVVFINMDAFSDCPELCTLSADEENPVYHTVNNCLIETSENRLIRGTSSSIIPDDGSVQEIAAHAFAFCRSLTEIYLPSTLTEIGTSAFGDCINLRRITIPCSVVKLGLTVFGGCDSLSELYVEKGNPIYHSENNCVIETAKKRLVQGTNFSVIPSDGSVEIIGERAFCLCRELKKLSVPNCVKTIEREAYDACPKLELSYQN